VNPIDPQQFGALQAQVAVLIESDRRKTELLETLTQEVTAMRLQMAEARGGWKALMLIGGASASLGGFATWLLTHMTWRLPP
jgi:hypothetical protein